MKNKIIALIILASASLYGWAQNNNVTGKVVDMWGDPVQGALIVVENNPSAKVATDKDGQFEIAAFGNDRLKVMTTEDDVKIVKVSDDQKSMTIVMDLSSQKVNYGFGLEQTRAESTGAASTVYSNDINTRSALTIGNSLYGNVLGLTTMQKTGTVWDQMPSMYIRGQKTLNGNNGILVVVDGLERDYAYNVLNYISPEEVESVTVLRDAAALALYGHKGVNGVINIVTKRGKYNSREISFSYDHAFNWQARKPELADSYTYANALNEALTNDGKSVRYSQNELNAFKSGQYPNLYPNVNWWEETFRDTGASDVATLTFRGGSTRMRYFTMLNLQNNSGFIANSDANSGYSTQEKFSKGNFRTNLDIELTPKTRMQANLMGVLNEFSRPGLGSDNLINKLYQLPSAAFPIKTEDGLWGGNATWDGYYNPVALTQGRAYTKGHTRALYADMSLRQDLSTITNGLGASVRLGYDNIASYWENHSKSFAYGSSIVTGWVNGEPTLGSPYTGGSEGTMASDSKLDWQYRSFNFQANIDYQRQFGDHSLYSMLMYSYKYDNRNGTNTTFYRQNAALYAHYGYKNRYFADLTLMGSASNVLETKWNLSPTVGLAWVISNEDFMKDYSWIDFMKLRASFGMLQTDNIPYNGYWYETLNGNGGGYPIRNDFSNEGSWQEGATPSLNGTAEKAFKYNLGLDLSLFKGLNFTVDGFYERRSDIWVSTAGKNSAVIGTSSAYANDGIVDSWGTEIGADYMKQIGDVRFNIGAKFTLSKNKIKEMNETPRPYDYLRSTGKSINQIFGYQAIGYFVDQADIEESPAQQFGQVKPGDIKYKDVNGDGVVNENDQIALGYNSVVPEVYYSFDLGLEWKGLGFSATFQGVGNYTAYLNTTSVYRPLVGDATISNYYYANRWTPENPNARFPRLTTEASDNNLLSSTVWLADRSFMKLRNCEIYYKLPASFLTKIKMKNAKVYVRGVDLLCFDSIDLSDPEAMGVAYPATRSVNVGFSFGF
ncbi:SusC/RagA family TonB-linked outer membrane protein [Bacteroides sp. OttesenSCG-928-F21]|nr:SusC/RagA family TonB-linked outer membrane protein [Bacteroides sp. OttesenSCG-928-F21]